MAEDVRNTVVTLVVGGLLATALVISTTRASVPPASAAENAQGLTPVPMSVEPTGPSTPPLTFAAQFAKREARTTLPSDEEKRIVERARQELERVTVYDNSWMETNTYPMGDVPASRGACTDVVVRSLRTIDIDLQQLVHEDIASDWNAYKLTWRDVHIDHRRVTTMHTFFERNAMSLTTNVHDKKAFRPGDVVFYTWSWGRSALAEHVAVVSDKVGPRGYLMVIQNGGPRPSESDGLDRPHMVGHYRALPKPSK